MALLTADTPYGTLQGTLGDKNASVSVFKGVPFAKPPVGPLRFAAPEPPESWSGVRLCDQWPKACIQFERKRPPQGKPPAGRPAGPMAQRPRREGSEDCLYLNVFTPAKTPDEKLPVLVWFFGGGYTNGWSADPEFRGEALAARGVVLITVNYRCGALGYAAHPFLTARSPHKASGNYGFLDQIAALGFIQQTVGAFGGDRERVTVFGQSAGGMSCRFLLCSPLSKGLFSRVIIESGGGLNEADPVRPLADMEKITAHCLRELNWSEEELLTKPAEELNSSLCEAASAVTGGRELFVFQPCLDGYSLLEVPGKQIAEGRYHEADIICGTVSGDSWMFTRKVRPLLEGNESALRAFAYSPGVAWARHQIKTGRRPIRTYFFERDQGGGLTPHSSEIAYIFGTLAARPYFTPTATDERISEIMGAYWANFAATGDPNGPGLPDWPLYTEETPCVFHVTDGYCRSEDILDNPEALHVMDFTEAHPGMLEALKDF